jgi:hypothetical protein
MAEQYKPSEQENASQDKLAVEDAVTACADALAAGEDAEGTLRAFKAAIKKVAAGASDTSLGCA